MNKGVAVLRIKRSVWGIPFPAPIPVLFFAFCLFPLMSQAQEKNGRIDKATRDVIVEKIAGLVEKHYLFPDKAKAVADAFRRKGLSEAYASVKTSEELAERFTNDLQTIAGDKHFQVRLRKGELGSDTGSPLRHPLHFLNLQHREHSGFTKLEWLEGNIAYVEIRRFYPPSAAKDMVAAVLKFLEDADAVILDIRENGGGDSDILPFFCAHFFDRSMPLTGTYFRDPDVLVEVRSREKVEGKRFPDVPLFLLTSPRTFSTAESFAYDMKVLKRAVIVGEATKGGAHSVDLFEIDDRFEMYIPGARAVNPITGGNWEGTGVQPDVLVPAAEALEKALALAKTAGAAYRKTKDDELEKAASDMQGHLERAEKLFRERRNESAEAELDAFFDLAGRHGLLSEFLSNILAISYPSEKNEQIITALLKKNIELFPLSSGAQEALAVAYWRSGKKESAIVHFRKVLELDPENRNAADMIKRLEKP